MHRFNGHDIEITQGDTLLFRIVLDGRDLPEGSVGYFTVKKNPKRDEALIEKKMNAGDGELIVQLDSADTNLPARTYYWDVRLLIPRDDGGYEVETPMEYAAFTVLEAVGEAGEYDDGMDADVPVISQLIKEAREAIDGVDQKVEAAVDQKVETVIAPKVEAEVEKKAADLSAEFLSSAAGAVANANIADRAINNAKLDFDSVTNAKIRAGTIQADRLTAEAQQQLTGGPYMQISMDGSTRVNITQGKHVFGLRWITDASRNLDTWLLNHSTWDGVYLHQGTDIEGPLLMLGRSDFIGGIHGDEHMTSVRMIADGVDVTGSAVELDNVKVFAVYVESKVYDMDSSTELFVRQKVLTFHGNRLTVENRWTYTGSTMGYVQRWPGCGLYSVYTNNALGVRTNENLMPSMQAQDWNKKITEAEFWVSSTHVTMKALSGMDNAEYAGSVEMLGGSARIKVYLDAIHSPEGHAVSAGDVLQASYEIEVS